RRHTRSKRDWSSDVCSSDLVNHCVTGAEGIRDTVVHVVVEDLERKALQCGRHGADLSEDVDAVPILLEHALDPAHLALDPVQSLDQRVLILRVPVHREDYTLGGYSKV